MWTVFGDVRRNELIFIVVGVVAGGHGSVFIEGRARKSHILERLGCGIFLWHALLLGFRGCASFAATGAGNFDRAQLGACYTSVLMMVNNCGDKRRPGNNAGVWAARHVCTMMILYARIDVGAVSIFSYRISVLRHCRETGTPHLSLTSSAGSLCHCRIKCSGSAVRKPSWMKIGVGILQQGIIALRSIHVSKD